MFVKVCGIKSKTDVDWAYSLGYTAVGIVMHKKSPRYYGLENAKIIADYAKNRILSVAVGVTCDEVKEIYPYVDYIQVYESKIASYIDTDRVIYAFGSLPTSHNYKYFLFDKSRGDGVFTSFPEWIKDIKGQIIVAGGLNCENIGNILNEIHPFGVDVSSGVEKDKKKSFALMKSFISIVHNFEEKSKKMRAKREY